MALFDRYLFASYSGAGENHERQGSIRLYRGIGKSKPRRLFPTKRGRKGLPRNFSRDSLRQRVCSELAEATCAGHRVIFGFGHQYGWPSHLREWAGIDDMNWREALALLADGDPETGLPPLDVPGRYCSEFNHFCESEVFWTSKETIAATYQIPRVWGKPLDLEHVRLTDRALAMEGRLKPNFADAVGGRGAGVLGGQTICGLFQLRQMLDIPDIAWWPFDGLSVDEEPYVGLHVGIENCAPVFRPMNIPKSGNNDAKYSCLFVRDADHSGELLELMNLDLAAGEAEQIQREGWIIGSNPECIPKWMTMTPAGHETEWKCKFPVNILWNPEIDPGFG